MLVGIVYVIDVMVSDVSVIYCFVLDVYDLIVYLFV